MSEKVYQLIDEVREKSLAIKASLETERSKLKSLESELDQLKEAIAMKESDLKKKDSEIAKLMSDLETNKTMGIDVPENKGFSDEQIDELVKEIEYCIAKLRS